MSEETVELRRDVGTLLPAHGWTAEVRRVLEPLHQNLGVARLDRADAALAARKRAVPHKLGEACGCWAP